MDEPAPAESILSCGFCRKTQREVRVLIAGPTVPICDECVDLLGNIVAEQRGAAAALRVVRLPAAQLAAGLALLSALPAYLRAARPGQDVVVSLRQRGDLIDVEVLSTGEGSRAAMDRALAAFALAVNRPAGEALPAADIRRLEAAGDAARSLLGAEESGEAAPLVAGRPPAAGDALFRAVTLALSNAGPLAAELRSLAEAASDAGVRAAADALEEALGRGFDARDRATVQPWIDAIAAAAPEALNRLRDFARQTSAEGGGALLAAWIAEKDGGV